MPSALSTLNLGQTVSFDTFAPSILGTSYRRAKVLAIVDADTAKNWIDPISMHAAVSPMLPIGSPANPLGDTYHYVKLRLQNGDVTCIGVSWIDPATIEVLVSTQITVVVDDVHPDKVETLRQALISNGFSSFSIT